MLTFVKGTGIATFRKTRKAVNHHQTIEVLQNGNRRQIEVSSDVSTVILELEDIDNLIGSNKAAKKMFILALIKLNQQVYSDGILKRNFIEFPLQELIDIGYYKRKQSARVGFKAAMKVLTSLKISGRLKKGKKKEVSQDAIEVLFTGSDIDNGVCIIYINERINWAFIAAFYTILPKIYFKLPNRASDLLWYIFYIARQCLKNIETKGYFNISMRAIHERLDLPNETETKNPDRDIKQKIEEAIEAIENEIQSDELTITPYFDENASISMFLNNGYLQIGLKGKFAKDFIAFSKEIQKAIKAAETRKEKIADTAKAINLAKKMEREATQAGDAS